MVYFCLIKQKQTHTTMNNNTNTNDEMTYTLTRIETGKKAAKYRYEIKDANGNLLDYRNSNREYVACTNDCKFFFGRLDLICKGDHGRNVKAGYYSPIAYLVK